MKKSIDDRQEEMMIREFLKHGKRIDPAPRHFTDRFMQKMELDQAPAAVSKPILDIKGKIAAWTILALLFVAGMSVGQEIGDSPAFGKAAKIVRQFIDFDFTIILTTVVFSFALLLAFNEFLKKRFVRR